MYSVDYNIINMPHNYFSLTCTCTGLITWFECTYHTFLSISLFSVGETQSTTLPHFYPFNLDGKKVTWYYMDNGKKEEVNTCKDPWQLTIDNNLVLSRARKEDNDRTYKAFLGDKLLNTITVNLMTKGK